MKKLKKYNNLLRFQLGRRLTRLFFLTVPESQSNFGWVKATQIRLPVSNSIIIALKIEKLKKAYFKNMLRTKEKSV